MILATLLAQAAADKPQANPIVSLLPIVLIFGAMYFLMIRPQRNKQRQYMELLRSLEVGDEVECVSGIYGTIRRLDDQSAWVEIAPGTTVRMSRAGIRRKVVHEEETETP
jgi:preprotein translocase subunit YajC